MEKMEVESENKEEKEEEEEIPFLTVKTEEEYAQMIEKLYWRPTFYKIVEFPIIDLLKAEKVSEETYFVHKNVDFKSVQISGKVVAVGEVGSKLLITVDDGTAKIDCILYINEKLRTFNQKVNEAFNVVINKEDEKKDNATIMLLSKCKSKLKTVATKNSDIKLGDRVILIGKLSTYSENRAIYIKNIALIDNQFRYDPKPFNRYV